MRRWVTTLGLIAGVQVLAALSAPLLDVSPLVGFLLAFASVCAAVVAVGSVAPLTHPPPRPAHERQRPPLFERHRPAALALLVIAVTVVLALAFAQLGGLAGAVCVAATLLAGGSFIGTLVGSRVQHPGHLLIVAYVTSLADAYSVLSAHGVSAQIVESEQLLSALAISWAIPGTEVLSPLLGVGDVVVAALYLGAARRMGLGLGRTALALGAGFTLVAATLVLAQTALPALPFLGLLVVATQPRTWRLPPSDRRTALMGLVIMTATVAALWLF